MVDTADDFWLAEAVSRFTADYASLIGDRRVDLIGKQKALLNFGRNVDMSNGVIETIWDIGIANETYVASNLIDSISSSSASDTITVRVDGHYYGADGNLHFVILNATLTGQTPVTTTSVVSDLYGEYSGALARVTRLANLSSVLLVGDVYVYQSTQTVTAGVPQDLTKVHAKIRGTAGLQQTNKAATTTSNEDFYIITATRGGVAKAQASFVDFTLEVREQGGVFREKAIGIGSRDSGFGMLFSVPPYLIVPPNADVRVRGTASANNTTGIAEFNGILGALI